jgi:hypothetical protein
LKAGYTEVWAPANVVPLIQFADCVRSIASTGLDLVGLPGIDPPPATVGRLRSFDSIVSWYGSNRDEFRSEVARLQLPFRFLPALPNPSDRIHAVDFFLREAGCSGPAHPSIHCPPAPQRDFAVIHPFSGSPRKNWPIDSYLELAHRLPLPVSWCAGPEEQLAGAVRFENLLELACWIRTARVYIGNDSGITHLAGAAGAPVVALFGPSDPAIWSPRGTLTRVVAGKLDDISVEQVLEVVLDLLRR